MTERSSARASFTGLFSSGGGGGAAKDEDAEFYYFVDPTTGQIWRERKDCLYLSLDEDDEDDDDNHACDLDDGGGDALSHHFSSTSASSSSSSTDEYGRNIDLSWIEDENERLQRERWERHQQRKEIRRLKRRRRDREARRQRRLRLSHHAPLLASPRGVLSEDSDQQRQEAGQQQQKEEETQKKEERKRQKNEESDDSSSGWELQEMEERELRERNLSLRALRKAAGLMVDDGWASEDASQPNTAGSGVTPRDRARQGLASMEQRQAFSGSFRRLLREENTKGGQTLLVMSASPITKRKEKERKRRYNGGESVESRQQSGVAEAIDKKSQDSAITGHISPQRKRGLALSSGAKPFSKRDQIDVETVSQNLPPKHSHSTSVSTVSSAISFSAEDEVNDSRTNDKKDPSRTTDKSGVKLDVRGIKGKYFSISPDDKEKKRKKSSSVIYSRPSAITTRTRETQPLKEITQPSLSSAQTATSIVSPRVNQVLSKSSSSNSTARRKIKRGKSEETLPPTLSSPSARSDQESGPDSASSGSTKIFRRAESEGEETSQRYIQHSVTASDEDTRSEGASGRGGKKKKKDKNKISRQEKKALQKKLSEARTRKKEKHRKSKKDKKEKKVLDSGRSYSERSESDRSDGKSEDSGSEKRVRAKDRIVRPSLGTKVLNEGEEMKAVDTRVGDFLRSLGLEKYEEVFIREEIDWMALRLMQVDHFKELGIPMGPRTKIAWGLEERAKAENESKHHLVDNVSESQVRFSTSNSISIIPTYKSGADGGEEEGEGATHSPNNTSLSSAGVEAVIHQSLEADKAQICANSSDNAPENKSSTAQNIADQVPPADHSLEKREVIDEASMLEARVGTALDEQASQLQLSSQPGLSPQENRQRILAALGRAQVLLVKPDLESQSQRKAQTVTLSPQLVQQIQRSVQQKNEKPDEMKLSNDQLGIPKGHISQLRARFEVLATEKRTEVPLGQATIKESANTRKRLFLSDRHLPRIQQLGSRSNEELAHHQERTSGSSANITGPSNNVSGISPSPSDSADNLKAVYSATTESSHLAEEPKQEIGSAIFSTHGNKHIESSPSIALSKREEMTSPVSSTGIEQAPPRELSMPDKRKTPREVGSDSPSDYEESDFFSLDEKSKQLNLHRRMKSGEAPHCDDITSKKASKDSRSKGKDKKKDRKKSPKKSKKPVTTEDEEGVEETGGARRLELGSSSSRKKKHKRSNSTLGVRSNVDKITINRSSDESDASASSQGGSYQIAPQKSDDEDVLNMPHQLKRRKSWSSPQKVFDKIERPSSATSSSSPVTKRSNTIRLNSSMSVDVNKNSVRPRRKTEGQQNISINTRADNNSIVTKLDLSFAGVSCQITSSPFSSADTDDDMEIESAYGSTEAGELDDVESRKQHKKKLPIKLTRGESLENEIDKHRSEKETSREMEKMVELEHIERERAREERLKEVLRQREREGMTAAPIRPNSHLQLQSKNDSSRFSLRNIFSPRSNSRRSNTLCGGSVASPLTASSGTLVHQSSNTSLNGLTATKETGLKLMRSDLSGSGGGTKGWRSDTGSGSGSESTGKGRRDRDREWEKAIDRERERRQREREKLRGKAAAAASITARQLKIGDM